MTALVAVSVVFRFLAMRRSPGDEATRAVFFALLFMEISRLLGYPPVYWFLHRLTGEIPSIWLLVQQLANMATAYNAANFTLAVVAPGTSTRWRTRLLFGSMAALVVCYLLGPFRLGLPILGSRGHTDPGVVAYVTTSQTYSMLVQAGLLRLLWRNRTPERDLLRTSLTLLGVGCALLVAQGVHKLYYLWAVFLGFPPSWADNGPSGVQIYLVFPGSVFFLLGLVLPSFGAWWTRRRLYRQLEPLASAVGTENIGVRGQRARLLTRVIGIRDALLGPLRSRFDSAVYEAALAEARDLGPDGARAHAEAACIAAALRGDEPSLPPPVFATPRPGDDAAWLAQVSVAYSRLAERQ
ncbi:DUF6545 domain-containing protein [Lentzea kentuckyensis]|uniref:DUF6545 domain-containing protein n=1 Tax=Lentzea kentuckyensis TaxID=360086 RepID=UPI000A3CAB22|nr:DUF6545 domain-containing protein [Lentzea kentuckyensis]